MGDVDESEIPRFHSSAEERLTSWKEVAVYLNRSVRTVQRWEKVDGLPIHRLPHSKRNTIYAYKSELDDWWNSHESRFAEKRPNRLALSAGLWAAGAMLVLGVAAAFWHGSELGGGPDSSDAGVTVGDSVILRRVWHGPDVDIMGGTSPDGLLLSYVDWATGDLAIHDLVTGKKHHLTDKGSWLESGEFAEFSKISPDGMRVAYAWRNQDMFYDLRIIDRKGSSPRVVYRDEAFWYIRPEAWSPDGQKILAVLFRKNGTCQIGLISVANGSLRVLKRLDKHDSSVDLSPDGRYLVYDLPMSQGSSNRDIFLLSIDGNHEMALVQHPPDDRILGWAPDGKNLLFASDRMGTQGIWILPFDEEQRKHRPILVKSDTGQIQPIGFTSQGSFYYGTKSHVAEVYVASVDLKTGTPIHPAMPAAVRFVGSNASPEWSPDGESLAYVSQWSTLWSTPGILCLRSQETGQERKIPLEIQTTQSSRLRWSPDSHFLLISSSFGQLTRVYQLDLQTGIETSVLEKKDDIHLAGISADSGSFYYSCAGSIRVQDLKTGRANELFHARADKLTLSPDYGKLAFVSFDRLKKPRAAVIVMSLTGGEPQTLFRAEAGETIGTVAWTPDGKGILFTKSDLEWSRRKTEFWLVATAGGEPVRLGLHIDEFVQDLRVHPDGRRIAFSVEQGRAEVWLLENFLPPEGRRNGVGAGELTDSRRF